MSKQKETRLVRIELEVMESLLYHATASGGLVEAAVKEYQKTGSFPIGSLVHVQRTVDKMAFDLAVIVKAMSQEELPF